MKIMIMKHNIYIPLILWSLLSTSPIFSQSMDYNFVRVSTMLDSGSTEKICYFDGLGRLTQEVQHGFARNGKDLVVFHEYDCIGRDSLHWLPVPIVGNGEYVLPSILKAASSTYYRDEVAYSHPSYEASPLNRILNEHGPGNAWINHPVGTEYLLNGTDYPCPQYKLEGDIPVYCGNYPIGQLSVVKTIDEDGNVSYQFKDSKNNLILLRKVNNGENYDTRYIYDVYGNLRCVLPPQVSERVSVSELELYAYRYKYDIRNRCIEKILPGCAPIYMVYDLSDRLVLTQDGEQRRKGQWMFTLSDVFDRPVLQGLCNVLDIASISSTRVVASFNYTLPEAGFMGTGYTFEGITLNSAETKLLKVYYYDCYHFLSLPVLSNKSINLLYDEEDSYGSRYVYSENDEVSGKGKLTGTRDFLIDNTMGEIIKVLYYDAKDRIIQQRSTNHLGGYEADFYRYTFTGKLLKHHHCHSVPYQPVLKEEYTYSYDHSERLKSIRHKLDENEEVILSENWYDELGRLWIENIHDALWECNYFYNIRNWITGISGPFNQQLYYTDSTSPCYNGNISQMNWGVDIEEDVVRSYKFSYDGLNRLTKAMYTEENADEDTNYDPDYTVNYGYDKMGNLVLLKRYGLSEVISGQLYYELIDELTMEYTGNQLRKITDESAFDPIYEGAFDYVDYDYSGEQEFFYDSNGNLIKNLSRRINEIQYNCLNLPNYLSFSNNGDIIRYSYSADGVKLRKEYGTSTYSSISFPLSSSLHMNSANSTSFVIPLNSELEQQNNFSVNETIDYCGNIIYENGVLSRILLDCGYITFKNGNPMYHYYMKDYQGNNRVVMDQNSSFEQITHYYPFGGLFGQGMGTAVQQYKYGGKYLERMHRLDWYDFGARHYDSAIGRFHTMDPLCEKYYSMSPYAYCDNNPINNVDLRGDSITTVVTSMVNGNVVNTTYYYGRDAQGNYGFLDSSGNLYSGGDRFVVSLTTALTKLRSGTKGLALADDLVNSTNTVQIGKARGSQTNAADPNGKYIIWDPTSSTGGPDQAGNTTRPSYIGLGHEMAHVQDVWNKTYDASTWTTIGNKTIPNAEKYATHVENQLRSEHGLSLRTHYSPGYNSTRLLDSRTNTSLFYKTMVRIGNRSIPTTPYIY